MGGRPAARVKSYVIRFVWNEGSALSKSSPARAERAGQSSSKHMSTHRAIHIIHHVQFLGCNLLHEKHVMVARAGAGVFHFAITYQCFVLYVNVVGSAIPVKCDIITQKR